LLTELTRSFLMPQVRANKTASLPIKLRAQIMGEEMQPDDRLKR